MTVLTDPDDPRRQDDQRPHDAPPRRLERQAAELPSHALDAADLAALELLLEGAFAPLRGFTLVQDAHGTPALPLHVGTSPAPVGTRIALHDSEGVTLAVLEVAGPVLGIRAPVRELFHRHRLPVNAIRASLAASGRTHAIRFSLRGVPDYERVRAHRAARRRERGAAAGDGLRRRRSGASTSPAAGCRAAPGRIAR
jgi:ATP sulfurylase